MPTLPSNALTAVQRRQKVSIYENSRLWVWIRSRQRLECCYQHPEISLEYRGEHGNLGQRPERFGRFDLYSGWTNPVASKLGL